MNGRARAVLVACCFAWIAFTLTAEARADSNPHYAIVVGNNAPPDWQPELGALRYADDDAIRFYRLLAAASRDARLLTVADATSQRRYPAETRRAKAPTVAALNRAVRDVAALARADLERGFEPVVFFVFSGHGAMSETGQYALALQDGALTKSALFEGVLRPMGDARVHVVIDACNAAGVVGLRGPFDDEADAELVRLTPEEQAALLASESLKHFPNVGALVASATGREAHEWSRIESGLFTHELLSALRGAADVNGDLRVEYSEVAAFIASANQGLPSAAGAATLLSRPPRTDYHAPLLDLRQLRDTAFLRGPVSRLGHFFIELEDGERLLDAHVDAEMPITLALPASRRAYVRTEQMEALLIPGRQTHFAELRFGANEAQPRGSADQMLASHWFSRAYSEEYYRGYADSRRLALVDFLAPKPAAVHEADEGETSTLGIALAIGSGAAIVAAGITGYVAIDARTARDSAESNPRYEELSSRSANYGTASLALGGVGVAAGLGAGWLLLRTDEGPSGERAVHVGVGGVF